MDTYPVLVSIAVADALGWQTEHLKRREDVERLFGVRFVNSFHTYERRRGSRFQRHTDPVQEGDYSDDTQLTLATARSILPDGTFDPDYFSKVELPALKLYLRGGGSTVKAAVEKITRVRTRWFSNFFTYRSPTGEKLDYRDSGANGVAMRIAPLALANRDNPQKGVLGVWQNAVCTHGHPRAILGALAHFWALVLLLHQADADEESLLKGVLDGVSQSDLPKSREFQQWKSAWEEDRGQGSFSRAYDETLREHQHLVSLLKSHLSDEGDHPFLKEAGAFNRATRGSGLVAAVAALFFFLKYRNDPQKAVLRIVNHLGLDTDTIASMTAALYAASGQAVLPELWEKVQDYEYLASALEGRLPKLPGAEAFKKAKKVPLETHPPLEMAQPGGAISHPLFGSGKVLGVIKQNLPSKEVVMVRVRWDYGQSMVLTQSLKGSKRR